MQIRRAISPLGLIAVLLLFLGLATAKADGEAAILHVTSVRQDRVSDWCDPGKCVATRFTVEGYRVAKNPTEVIRYVLECVEVTNLEAAKVTLNCVRVQAGEDYDVKVWPDAIVLQPPEPPTEGTTHGAYSIKSQKEEKKDK